MVIYFWISVVKGNKNCLLDFKKKYYQEGFLGSLVQRDIIPRPREERSWATVTYFIINQLSLIYHRKEWT
jgi:hypothetical protein